MRLFSPLSYSLCAKDRLMFARSKTGALRLTCASERGTLAEKNPPMPG
jgi:hypothetical protein